MSDEKELEEIAMSEPAIKKALEYQTYFMHDEKLRRKYELQEKAIRDYNSSMLAAREEGAQNKAHQIAINLLNVGLSIDFISKNTGLSIEEVKSLRKML